MKTNIHIDEKNVLLPPVPFLQWPSCPYYHVSNNAVSVPPAGQVVAEEEAFLYCKRSCHVAQGLKTGHRSIIFFRCVFFSEFSGSKVIEDGIQAAVEVSEYH